jgi:hypothetical protein
MDTFENVMELAIEGCKAIANYIREVMTFYCFPSFVDAVYFVTCALKQVLL